MNSIFCLLFHNSIILPIPLYALVLISPRNQPFRPLEAVFVVHATLWTEDKSTEITTQPIPNAGSNNSNSPTRESFSNPNSVNHHLPTYTRLLMGSLVSSLHRLSDTSSQYGDFFIFHDLSIRQEGRFRLKFSLMNLAHTNETNSVGKVLTEVFSDVVTVYSAKRFPGMTESTELSKCFARQGVKIPVRNEVRVSSRKSQNKKRTAESGDDDEPEEDGYE
ncbi:velvet factor-domain-containing protein [Paraphysoderma sedebokerense]|nr:velvet factor-domain-containing protein [Paraphysoderma sedebokerense]